MSEARTYSVLGNLSASAPIVAALRERFSAMGEAFDADDPARRALKDAAWALREVGEIIRHLDVVLDPDSSERSRSTAAHLLESQRR